MDNKGQRKTLVPKKKATNKRGEDNSYKSEETSSHSGGAIEAKGNKTNNKLKIPNIYSWLKNCLTDNTNKTEENKRPGLPQNKERINAIDVNVLRDKCNRKFRLEGLMLTLIGGSTGLAILKLNLEQMLSKHDVSDVHRDSYLFKAKELEKYWAEFREIRKYAEGKSFDRLSVQADEVRQLVELIKQPFCREEEIPALLQLKDALEKLSDMNQ